MLNRTSTNFLSRNKIFEDVNTIVLQIASLECCNVCFPSQDEKDEQLNLLLEYFFILLILHMEALKN